MPKQNIDNVANIAGNIWKGDPVDIYMDMYYHGTAYDDASNVYDQSLQMGMNGEQDLLGALRQEDPNTMEKAAYQQKIYEDRLEVYSQMMPPPEAMAMAQADIDMMQTPWGTGLMANELELVLSEYPGISAFGGDSKNWDEVERLASAFMESGETELNSIIESAESSLTEAGQLDQLWDVIRGIGDEMVSLVDGAGTQGPFVATDPMMFLPGAEADQLGSTAGSDTDIMDIVLGGLSKFAEDSAATAETGLSMSGIIPGVNWEKMQQNTAQREEDRLQRESINFLVQALVNDPAGTLAKFKDPNSEITDEDRLGLVNAVTARPAIIGGNISLINDLKAAHSDWQAGTQAVIIHSDRGQEQLEKANQVLSTPFQFGPEDPYGAELQEGLDEGGMLYGDLPAGERAEWEGSLIEQPITGEGEWDDLVPFPVADPEDPLGVEVAEEQDLTTLYPSEEERGSYSPGYLGAPASEPLPGEPTPTDEIWWNLARTIPNAHTAENEMALNYHYNRANTFWKFNRPTLRPGEEQFDLYATRYLSNPQAGEGEGFFPDFRERMEDWADEAKAIEGLDPNQIDAHYRGVALEAANSAMNRDSDYARRWWERRGNHPSDYTEDKARAGIEAEIYHGDTALYAERAGEFLTPTAEGSGAKLVYLISEYMLPKGASANYRKDNRVFLFDQFDKHVRAGGSYEGFLRKWVRQRPEARAARGWVDRIADGEADIPKEEEATVPAPAPTPVPAGWPKSPDYGGPTKKGARAGPGTLTNRLTQAGYPEFEDDPRVLGLPPDLPVGAALAALGRGGRDYTIPYETGTGAWGAITNIG